MLPLDWLRRLWASAVVVPRFDLALRGGEVLGVMRRILLGQGNRPSAVGGFERQFADWLGVRHAIFLPSARSGLFLLLRAAGELGLQGRQNGVLVPAWTHASVPLVVRASGSQPLFVDCDAASGNASPSQVATSQWEKAWAVVITHLYGNPAAVEEWRQAARQHDLFVLEDCAQALGARSGGQRCGSFGDASYFSFSLTKNFTTLGGGMVATSRDDLADCVRAALQDAASAAKLLKPAGMALGFRLATRPAMFAATLYPALRLGWALYGRDLLHGMFDEPIRFQAPPAKTRRAVGIQAELGSGRLPGLDDDNQRRRAIGYRLRDMLEGTPQLGLPCWRSDAEPIFMSFVLRSRRRMDLMRGLLQRGVDTSPGYLRACNRLEWSEGECPQAEALEHEQVHLPIYPRLSTREVEHIARATRAVAERVAR